MNSLFDKTNSLFPQRTGNYVQDTGIAAQIDARSRQKALKWSRNFENSLLIPCSQGENSLLIPCSQGINIPGARGRRYAAPSKPRFAIREDGTG
jgi:hypothetical protein